MIGYRLSLANGQGWDIIGSEETSLLVDKLALVMKLKPDKPNGFPRLIISTMPQEKKGKDFMGGLNIEELPLNGWEIQDFISLQFWFHPDVPDVIYKIKQEKDVYEDVRKEYFKMSYSLYPVYRRTVALGGLPLHAGLIRYNGDGILLAGPTNVGKSTCCRRLNPPWHCLCDDEALIVRDNQSRYRVHPFPTWNDYLYRPSDKKWDVQYHLPLRALFFLEQAETDEVVPLTRAEATIFINRSVTEVTQLIWLSLTKKIEKKVSIFRKRIFENACELSKSIPTFSLRVSLKGRFWEKIEKALK